MDNLIVVQIPEPLQNLLSVHSSGFLCELFFLSDQRKKVELAFFHNYVDVIIRLALAPVVVLDVNSAWSVNCWSFFNDVAKSCQDIGMLTEKLDLHLIDQVVHDHFVLLEVFQCNHHACFLVKSWVNLAVLPLAQLLENVKILYWQWLYLLFFYRFSLYGRSCERWYRKIVSFGHFWRVIVLFHIIRLKFLLFFYFKRFLSFCVLIFVLLEHLLAFFKRP